MLMEYLSTVVICVLLAAICVYAVFSYRKKLKGGCCGGGDTEVKIKPQNTAKSHYAHKSRIYIDGMTCNHCALRVKNAFNTQDGCCAKVHLRKKFAELRSERILSEEELRQILEPLGYTFVKSVPEQ